MTSRLGVVGVLLAVSLSSTGASSASMPVDPVPQFCLPQWAQDILLHKDVAARVELVDILARPVAGACDIAPWFLEDDFNNDGKLDVAVRGRDRQSGFHGIIIANDGESQVHILGFSRLDENDEKRTYRFSHIRTRKSADGKNALVVTPFKYEADVWQWTGSRYELDLESSR